MSHEAEEALRRFIELFRQGKYFESHECLEDYWRDHREPFYQGLIQLAVARHHAERANPRGAKTQALKSFQHLAPYFANDEHPGEPYGIDIAQLLTHLIHFVQSLDRGERIPPAPPLGEMHSGSILPSFLEKRKKKKVLRALRTCRYTIRSPSA